jgi:hypothetical protein
MQLTKTQLATIETYLLSWELQFRDFYDEMFDHFCTEIEQRMSTGTSFDNALAETSYLFDSYEFKEGFNTKYYGLKAYEMEWFGKYKTKHNGLLFTELKKQLFTLRLLIWVTAFLVIYQACLRFDYRMVFGLTMAPSLIALIFTQTKILSWRKFTWKSTFLAINYKNAGKHKTKDSLFAKPHTLLHFIHFVMSVLVLCLNVPHLLISRESMPLAFYISLSVALMLIAKIAFDVTDEVIKQEKALGNKFLTNAD